MLYQYRQIYFCTKGDQLAQQNDFPSGDQECDVRIFRAFPGLTSIRLDMCLHSN